MIIFYVFRSISTAKSPSISLPLKTYMAPYRTGYTTIQCHDVENYNSRFYLSEKLISYMELRNLIDKILLSAADLISLSVGVKRKGGCGWGGGGALRMYLLPFSFRFKNNVV